MRTIYFLLIVLFASTLSNAQNYPPAVDYSSLMNMRFYEQSGGFMIETLPIIFPPNDDAKMEFEIIDANGKTLFTSNLRLQKLDNFKTFGILTANGPGIVHLKQTGGFIINIKTDGKVITHFPFSMTTESSSDPYNPSTLYLREGPWKSLAYFSFDPDNSDELIKFNWWTNLREIPNSKKAKITVSVMKGNSEIALSESPKIVSYKNWQAFNSILIFPDKKNTKHFTINELTKGDGVYSVILKADDKPFKSFSFTVSKGKIDEIAQNDLNYSPHKDFIARGILDVSSGSNSSYKVLQACWIKAR